ncbi:uncharacterized protein LOC108831089 [Raphanus sativus]|uniref:Uncharacterized protein LOC108831089 n=1 Tax=Raphanus sativus TaxID=3726 RepID=A0A6J0LJP0_RAPSA|nr:uncharacterized protein LOC108831089 [Raphanus sativus]
MSGDSMFHTALWTSEHSSSIPPLKSIKLWAHLHGVPLDLRHTKGLSLVAGLIGHPKETDDFTKNLVSLTESHVKVELDLTEPAPTVVEFERESGEVVEVLVTYPWLPPTCSHCQELGHVIKNCLTWTPPEKEDTQHQKTPLKGKSKSRKKAARPTTSSAVNTDDPSGPKVPPDPKDTVGNSTAPMVLDPILASTSFSFGSNINLPSTKKPPSRKSSQISSSPSTPKKPLSLSEFAEKKKLKRTRSDPSFDSPPHQTASTTVLPKGVLGPLPLPLSKQISIPINNSFSAFTSFDSQGLSSSGVPPFLS